MGQGKDCHGEDLLGGRDGDLKEVIIHKDIGKGNMQWVSAVVVEGDLKARTAMARISLGAMDVVTNFLPDMVDFRCRTGCVPCRLPLLITPADHSH